MKPAALIALLKDARGALHGANHGLVQRIDATIAEFEKALVAEKSLPERSIPRRTAVEGPAHE